MIALDRDLLAAEPTLFRDVVWSSQRVLSGEGDLDGFVLNLSTTDVGFDEAGVVAGHVVMIGASGFEVIDRINSKSVRLSRVRAKRTDTQLLRPYAKPDRQVVVMSFLPQLQAVHELTLRMAGLELSEEARILNPSVLLTAQTLGALAAVYFAAGAGTPQEGTALQRAAMYQRRFEIECERVTLRLDLDGDGVADTTRRLAGGPMLRG